MNNESNKHFPMAGQRRYVYLLCVWAESRRDPAGQPLWRFSLEEVRTGVRHGFGDWQALLAFLEKQIEDG